MRLKFTEFAYSQLQEICAYYSNNGYDRYANKLRNSILEDVQRLIEMPEIGRRYFEANSPYEHRFRLVERYRIYYKIEQDNDRIVVVYIFDTRQDPNKIHTEFPDE